MEKILKRNNSVYSICSVNSIGDSLKRLMAASRQLVNYNLHELQELVAGVSEVLKPKFDVAGLDKYVRPTTWPITIIFKKIRM